MLKKLMSLKKENLPAIILYPFPVVVRESDILAAQRIIDLVHENSEKKSPTHTVDCIYDAAVSFVKAKDENAENWKDELNYLFWLMSFFADAHAGIALLDGGVGILNAEVKLDGDESQLFVFPIKGSED